MRILWFSNTQAVGTRKGIGCSWIGSLEAELSKIPDIQLGIAFNSKYNCESPFTEGNISYYPMILRQAKSKLHQLFYRLTHKLESEDHIELYLNVIQQFKPDIIHIFGAESDFGLIINKISVPCIIHLQGILTVINLKWYSDLSLLDILKYSRKSLLLRGHGLFHDYYISKKAEERERRIFQSCKYFMGRTEWDRRISFILSPTSRYFKCEEIMRSGFYLHQWKAKPDQNKYQIITTIKNNIYKGLGTIFKCKEILRKHFRDYEVVWKIAGLIEEDEISYLIWKKYKVKFWENNIRLLGRLQEDELIAEMLESDIFVHASHIENSPNSVCEAMMLGMPIIATYAGGTPSMLNDSNEGLLVQDGDPYALAGAIIELIKDRNLAHKLGINARNRSLVRNNPERIVNDLLRIYSSVISEN